VVRSPEPALWAFSRHDDFAGAVLAAVNLGDDADTTGAVCGQLAGARFRHEAIPSRWLDDLAERERLVYAARRLRHVTI